MPRKREKKIQRKFGRRPEEPPRIPKSETLKGRRVEVGTRIAPDDEITFERIAYVNRQNKEVTLRTKKGKIKKQKLRAVVIFSRVKRNNEGLLVKVTWRSKRHRTELKQWKRPASKKGLLGRIERKLAREKVSHSIKIEQAVIRVQYARRRRR